MGASSRHIRGTRQRSSAGASSPGRPPAMPVVVSRRLPFTAHRAGRSVMARRSPWPLRGPRCQHRACTWPRSCRHLATRSSASMASSPRTQRGVRRWCRQRAPIRCAAQSAVRVLGPRHLLSLPANSLPLRKVETPVGRALRRNRHSARSHLREQSPPSRRNWHASRSAASTGLRC
jgi:hypothetical protein